MMTDQQAAAIHVQNVSNQQIGTHVDFPLNLIDKNNDKTPEHWFNHYAVEIQKIGFDKIPLINKDSIKKHSLVRFRGIISNQINNEYFGKSCQYRDIDDVKQIDLNNDINNINNNNNNNNNLMERYPMIIRKEPNQTKWSKSIIYNNKNMNNQINEINEIIAKFYCHSKSLKICDFVEIYGIWSPIKKKNNNNNNNNNSNRNNNDNSDLLLTNNAYNNLSTLHVLYWKKIEYNNPLISDIQKQKQIFNKYYLNASLIRTSLIKYIAINYLFNDYLLSEYILLHLISSIISASANRNRNGNGVLIGNFSLNIRGNFNSFNISELYSNLIPNLLNINLSLNNLNNNIFVPVKNNKTDELDIGILQFTDNTHIIIDQTCLTQGKLNQNALKNIDSLQLLLNEQRVLYDFKYHSIPFNVNSTICVLSRSKPLKQLNTHSYIYYDGDDVKDNATNSKNVNDANGGGNGDQKADNDAVDDADNDVKDDGTSATNSNNVDDASGSGSVNGDQKADNVTMDAVNDADNQNPDVINDVDNKDDQNNADDSDDSDDSDDDDDDPSFTLNDYRIYLSLASNLLNKFELNSKEVTEGIENDFVSMRQKDKKVNENTLHHRLLLMRLINSSFLNQTDDNDMMNILKYMQMLETKRKIRNQKYFKIKSKTKTNPKSTGTPLNTINELS